MDRRAYKEVFVGCLKFQADKIGEISQLFLKRGESDTQHKTHGRWLAALSEQVAASFDIQRDFSRTRLTKEEVQSALDFLDSEVSKLDSELEFEVEKEFGPLDLISSETKHIGDGEVPGRILKIVTLTCDYQTERIQLVSTLSHLAGTSSLEVIE